MTEVSGERAAKAVIVLEARILVLEKAADAFDPTTDDGSGFDLPGGRALPGETFVEALVREVLEETGLSIVPIKLLEKWRIAQKRDSPLHGRTYLCAVTGGQLRMSAEHHGCQWLSEAEIPVGFAARSACLLGLRLLASRANRDSASRRRTRIQRSG